MTTIKYQSVCAAIGYGQRNTPPFLFHPHRARHVLRCCGRDPQNGESVTLLDAVSQTYTTTVFENGVWDNGTPILNIGQSAFFNLEPVPEPAVYNLVGAGLLLLATVRKRVFK